MAVPTFLAAPANANGSCATWFLGRGTGTSADPYLVSTADDLSELRFCRDKAFKQTENITLTATWTPVGTAVSPFEGIYDGGGFQISGLSTTATTATRVGLFGVTSGATIRNTNISGSIVGTWYVGGLIGYAVNTTVTASTADVTIAFGGAIVAGGLIGYAGNTTVTQSRATGAITGQIALGGLIGQMIGGNLSKSFATGVVTGNDQVGGLVGDLLDGATVSDVYARGAATVFATAGGGLLGSLDDTVGAGELARAYSTGRATGPESAGFIGVATGARTLTASFWDTQTSGQASAVYDDVVTGVTGLTTLALTDIATYRAAGWNIGGWAATGTTWGICSGVNDGYPYLQAFYASNPCDDGPTPPPWHQAYARASGDTCVEGWNPSWAEWPNGNTGGFVCVRTLVYNRSTGRWDVHK